MPDPRRLITLTELRKTKGLSLADMAGHCGLVGKKRHESASAWERGRSIPHASHRPHFIAYLANILGLEREPERLLEVWQILVDEWRWEPLSEGELQAAISPSTPLQRNDRQARTPQAPLAKGIPPPRSLPPGSRMPFSRNPLFVGRGDDLQAIAQGLLEYCTAAIIPAGSTAVTGIGGIGKTQLAVEFVYCYGHQFPGGVFWLSLADPGALLSEIAACGATLNLHPDFGRLSLDQQVRLVMKAWEQPVPRLLVFDNCEEPGLVEQWRPTLGGCRILITSRRAQWDANLGITLLPLSVLARAESLSLLQNHCPAATVADSPALTAIAAELGDLPLALHLAGSYLARAALDQTPVAYLAQLQGESTTAVVALSHPSFAATKGSPTGHVQHLARTFALSYDRLHPINPRDNLARKVLARAAHFAPGELIPRALLAATAPTANTRLIAEALDRLIELGLLEMTGEEEDIRLHRLVVAFVRQVAPDPQAQEAVEETILQRLHYLNEIDDHPTLLTIEKHLHAVITAAETRVDTLAGSLCYEMSLHRHQIGTHAEALHYNARSIIIREKLGGPENLALVANLRHLSWMFQSEGRYDDAFLHSERALAICRAVFGEEHTETATSYTGVGNVVMMQGDFAAARQHYLHALGIHKQVSERNHPETAETLNNLGLLHVLWGRYLEALPYLEQALTIREQGDNLSLLSFTLNNLGYLLRKMARYAEAQPYLERALAIREHIFGPTAAYVAFTLSHIARIAHYQGQYAEAQSVFTRVLEMRRQEYQPYHPDIANTLSNLGMLRFDQGYIEEARLLVEEALRVHQVIWGENHWHTARSHNHLGIVLQAAGDLVGGESEYGQALAVRVQLLGEEHPDTANTRGHLARLRLDQGRVDQAMLLAEQALAAHLARLGQAHPYTARSLMVRGSCKRALGQTSPAQQDFIAALATYEEVFGSWHPFVARALHALSTVATDQQSSLALLQRALTIYEQSLGKQHPETQIAQKSLSGEKTRRE